MSNPNDPNDNIGQLNIPQPQPKEGKPRTSWIKTGILFPGAILAGIFLLIATAIGIGKLFGSAKKKRPKSTQLDI